MTRNLISLEDLEALVLKDIVACSHDLRSFYTRVAVDPVKWQQCPWGRDGGFWALAIVGNRVLWYNDIEGGFNVSRFVNVGTIPGNEYWCNQDSLCLALHRLASDDESWRREC